MNKYILAIDQGTTSCRAILYNLEYEIISSHQKEFTQIYPQEGWVEHHPNEIWETQRICCKYAISNAEIPSSDIICIGITNQRETIVAWNKLTGQPIYNAIVWQDRRTAKDCEMDIRELTIEKNRQKTGLSIDAYFSAPKIRWIIQHVPEARELIFKNELCIGTIDSWLIWKLTHGKQFITDYSNASRTNMFNIQSLEWDRDLLNYYEIPMSILPQVRDSIGTIGYSEFDIFGAEIPISSIAGDQQAALYGHQCFETGSLKNTFGTGCFLLQNIGSKFRLSENKLLTTIGWKEQAEIVYAIEGSVFNAGSALKWLKENLQLIQSYEEIEDVCHSIPDTEGVYFVPAFTGLGAPHWDMYARGTIVGMTRNTDRRHIIRATIESIAFQTKDIVDTMKKDSGLDFDKLKVDGGVSESKFLLQFLADILQIPIIHSESKECTALGAAMMAAKGIGLADNPPTIDAASNQIVYNPDMGYDESKQHYKRWEDALERSKGWAIKG